MDHKDLFKRVLWPERASFFVVIGGALGLSGDITSFFSEFLNPVILLGIFAFLVFFTGYPCFLKAVDLKKKLKTDNSAVSDEDVSGVVNCVFCDAMRFSLFATGAFIFLLLIGQGQSATETIGEKLGLIHKDIGEISKNVETISSNVEDISDVMQAQKIIANPKTEAEFFANAWTYTYVQRNEQKAHETLNKMYQSFAPQKMDAAEIFFSSGRQKKERSALLAEMEQIADRNGDATLLVIAGRNSPDINESQRLYKKAQKMNPKLPFAFWDIQKFTAEMQSTNIDAKSQAEKIREEIAEIESFISIIDGKPASNYFFMTQHQPDHEMVARQTLGNLRSTLQSYEKMEEKLKSLKN